jgi:WD40 repeat protein
VLLWDSSSRKLITTAIQGLDDSVEAAAFSPDGSRVVAIFSDSSTHLLNVTPMGHITLACQRLGRHQLLRNPKALSVGPEFEAIAARARKVCAKSTSSVGQISQKMSS